MKFYIEEGLAVKYPDVKIGVVIATGVNNKGASAGIEKLLGDAQELVKQNFSIDKITENPTIEKWRQIYSDFGSKPRDYRCSIEALLRSVLNGRPIRHINKLVDLYNYISLKYTIPVGGEDLDKIDGDLHLMFARGSENFIPLGSAAAEKPYNGEVIYCDNKGDVLCRRWNWRESDKTKLTEETRNAIIVLEGFDSGIIKKATEELAAFVKNFCVCETSTFIASRDNPEIEW